MILAGTQGGTTGGSQTQCAPVTFNPNGGDPTSNEVLNTSTLSAHIFYTKTNDNGVNPTHTGDNATGSTTRIGTNTGSIGAVGTYNHSIVIRALAYKAGLLDSVITETTFDPVSPGGP